MTISTTLQSKILKMKKRLSDHNWLSPCQIIALAGLIGTIAFCIRATSISWNFGVVNVQIPLLQVPVNPQTTGPDSTEPRPSNYELGRIDKNTVAIAISETALIFGDLRSFTTNFSNPNNKFHINHIKGSPQLGELLTTLGKWQKQRQILHKINPKRFVILVPDDHLPAALVIQTIHHLKESELFDHVVLGGGLI